MANFPDDDAPQPEETHLQEFPPAWKVDYQTYAQPLPEKPRVLIYRTKALWTGILYCAVFIGVAAVVVGQVTQAISKVKVLSPNLFALPDIPALGVGAAVATIMSGFLYAEISRFTEHARFFYFALHGLGTLMAAGSPFLMRIDPDAAIQLAILHLVLGVVIGVAMHWVVPKCVIHPHSPLPEGFQDSQG